MTGTVWDDPAHDRSGNMTELPQPDAPTDHYHARYDAWNRLVEVLAANDTTVIAEYVYDGRNFRTVKKTYTDDALDETRHFYYNNQWQCLEERVDEETRPDVQYVWGARYIDDLILRDRDADASSLTGNLGGTSSGLEERLYALQDANLQRRRPLRRLRATSSSATCTTPTASSPPSTPTSRPTPAPTLPGITRTPPAASTPKPA